MKTMTMNLKKTSLLHAISFGLLAVLGYAQTARGQQWGTDPNNSNNIYYNAGNVGIGMMSPTSLLHVNGDVRANRGSFGGASPNYDLQVYSATGADRSVFAAGVSGFSNGFKIDYMHSAQAMKYTFVDGNVGIGTTSPREKLEIATDFGPLRIYGRGGIDQPGIWYNTYYNGSAWVRDNSSYGRSSVQFSAAGHLLFLTAGVADGYPPERMRIDNSGNVGIGTTSPAWPLHTRATSTGVGFSNSDFVIGATGTVFNIAYGASTGNTYTSLQTTTSGGIVAGNTVLQKDGGNVGIGNPSPQYKLDVSGTAHVTGNMTVDGNISAKYQDVAEWVPASEQLSAGTVVVLDSTKSNQVTSSSVSYDTRVAGVVSEQPGIALGEKSEGKVLVATTGRVRVKVDASIGPIHIGDLLVTSDVLGVAMKSEPVEFAGRKMHMPGTLIGKALEPLEKGKGEILVLLSLQ